MFKIGLVLAVAVVGLVVALILLAGQSQPRQPTTTATTPPRATSNVPLCEGQVSIQQCSEAGCAVELSLRGSGEYGVYIDSIRRRTGRLPDAVSVDAPYNSTIEARSGDAVCIRYHVPALALNATAAVKAYDAEARRWLLRVEVYANLPASGFAKAATSTVALQRGRGVADVWADSLEVPVTFGAAVTTARAKAPAVNLTDAYCYPAEFGYACIASYEADVTLYTRYGILKPPNGTYTFTAQTPPSKTCLAESCVAIRTVYPTLEVTSVKWYWVYNAPVALMELKKVGPGIWRGDVEVESYAEVGAGYVRTVNGAVYAPWPLDTSPTQRLRDVTVKDTLTLTVAPIGNEVVVRAVSVGGNQTLRISVPPPPRISISYNCTLANTTAPVSVLRPELPYASRVVSSWLCSVAIRIHTGQYAVYPYAELKVGQYTAPIIPKALVLTSQTVRVDVSIPAVVWVTTPVAGWDCERSGAYYICKAPYPTT